MRNIRPIVCITMAIIAIVMLAPPTQAQAQRQPNFDDLYNKLGRCRSDLDDANGLLRQYDQALAAAEKELADLKAKTSPPAPAAPTPPTPAPTPAAK